MHLSAVSSIEVKFTEENKIENSFEGTESMLMPECLLQKTDVNHLPGTANQRRKTITRGEMKGSPKEYPPQLKEIVCETFPQQKSVSHLAVSTHRRIGGKATTETKELFFQAISECLPQRSNIDHLPASEQQRKENMTNGEKEGGNVSKWATSEDNNIGQPETTVKKSEAKISLGAVESSRTLKQNRKTRLSNKKDTVERPSYGNTAAAFGGDGDNTAAISDTGIRNGFIQQMHCGKARNHQFPVTRKKHVRLTKETSREKNKALKYVDAMDDHQLSESLSEDYDLPGYDNILMIVDQLQMKYKDSGKPLEFQDAVLLYKMMLEHNQSHSELLIKKHNNKRNQGHRVMKKPRETEKAKLQLSFRSEEQQLNLMDVGSPEKQEVQQRNADGWYENMKKQLTEKDQQYEREKQQLELRLRAQDMELQHLRNDINKLQETQHPETEAGHGDSMTKGHLQKVEHEVSKLVEIIKKQNETIEQLERKLTSEDKTLAGTDHLTQAGRDFFSAFREMYTTSVMSQLELRIQHLEREFSEMKTRTCENVMVLENYVKLHQSHKLMETEGKMKEVMTQFAVLTQHNTALLNLLSSIFASECPCKATFHRRSGSLFTQENMLTSTSGPQPANQSVTAHPDVPADDKDDSNKALTKSILSPQSEPHQEKKKCLESAKEKMLRKKCFKRTKTSTVYENREHSFSEVSNTRQFEKNIPTDEPQHEIIREDQETLDNIPGNHNALSISPWEFRCTDLESERSEERTHPAFFCIAEREEYKDPYLEWAAMTHSSPQGQLRSKGRQDGSMRRNFNKMEAYTSTSNTCMMSSGPEFRPGRLYNSFGYSRNFLQREPLRTTLRPQTFENSLSFPSRVREENQQTSYDKVGHHNASCVKPQKATLSTLQSKHPEVTQQASYKAEPKRCEEPHPERIEMTKPLTYDQLKSKDRQDESVRRNFDKMEAYSSVPDMYTPTSPAPGFGSGQHYINLEHSRSLRQKEAATASSRPWRFVESLDSYLWRKSYKYYLNFCRHGTNYTTTTREDKDVQIPMTNLDLRHRQNNDVLEISLSLLWKGGVDIYELRIQDVNDKRL
ncbi:uncharacterized protein LOC110317892 [Mus pahari]|uniref:uncharacterized protein LOC110317892 n=1 Tax=Mus pahari TaxID=10093 RepID=UPI000A30F360|nr:uncharacterized protein LOC110317892 [Mus pahari]